MKERDRLVVSGLVALLLVLWLGFLFHSSPRFAGSLWGGVLGVSGAILMVVPLAYLVVKRIPLLKKTVTRCLRRSLAGSGLRPDPGRTPPQPARDVMLRSSKMLRYGLHQNQCFLTITFYR